jgi:FkbM family methyltransferase
VPVPLGNGVRIVADLSTSLGVRAYRYQRWDRLDPDILQLDKFLTPGCTFVDGGANVGLFALYAAAAVGPSGRVLAFEPSPETSRALRANVRLNRFAWLDVYEVALAESEGVADFIDLPDAPGFSSFAPRQSGGRRMRVDTISLDDVVQDVEGVAIVKLDLEGGEVGALRGAGRLLSAGVPFLVEIEDEHLRRQGATAEDLRAIFGMAGYEERPLPPGPNAVFERPTK